MKVSVPDTLCFKSKTKEGTFCYLEKIDENVYTFKQEKSEKSMLCLNAVFLKELKGHKFILEFKSQKDKVIFRFLNNDTIIHDVGYVVMPIKNVKENAQ